MTNSKRQSHRYKMTVDQYASFHRDGFLNVRGLLPQEDAGRLSQWVDDIYHGRLQHLDHLSPIFGWMTDQQKTERLASGRMHMPHRHNETAEWGLLHPCLLDVLEALIGPDVLALQSMLFFNPPAKGGQGWHQDSFYIQTQPDTLIGAWIAIDRANEKNGCLWVAPGSHNEPIYPPDDRSEHVHPDERHIQGLFDAKNASNMDDSVNNLSGVAAKYGEPVPVIMEPGDILFFHSHLLHRSYRNETADQLRRSYVLHYCNARSWVPWDGGNEKHILARGRTHLPYAAPIYGTQLVLAPVPGGLAEDNGSKMVAKPDGGMGKLEM